MKTRIRSAAWVLAVLAASTVPAADNEIIIPAPPGRSLPQVDATVHLSGRAVALGVGYSWGHGIISYGGKSQAFCIRAFSLGDVGAVRLEADGLVFHLSSLEDFPGKYTAISTGTALLGGGSAAVWKNDHGVTIQLQTRLRGIAVSLAGSRIDITPAGPRGCPSGAKAGRRPESTQR